jgi:CO/xanthine dehydrogenase FAD-binding subunit
MIIEYHRPKNLDTALKLLTRQEPPTYPMGGGSVLNQPRTDQFAVVDLQDLGLNTFQNRGNALDLGATINLQSILAIPELPNALLKTLKHEATHNLRQVATIAGRLIASDGRSPLTTTLLALDTTLILEPGEEKVFLGDLLPLREEKLLGRLVTRIQISLNTKLFYEYVARTPADLPIICVSLAQWPSGRTRLALGGYGEAPILAFDGSEAQGIEVAARSAYSHAEDTWASSEYRQEMAAVLTRRCLSNL